MKKPLTRVEKYKHLSSQVQVVDSLENEVIKNSARLKKMRESLTKLDSDFFNFKDKNYFVLGQNQQKTKLFNKSIKDKIKDVKTQIESINLVLPKKKFFSSNLPIIKDLALINKKLLFKKNNFNQQSNQYEIEYNKQISALEKKQQTFDKNSSKNLDKIKLDFTISQPKDNGDSKKNFQDNKLNFKFLTLFNKKKAIIFLTTLFCLVVFIFIINK